MSERVKTTFSLRRTTLERLKAKAERLGVPPSVLVDALLKTGLERRRVRCGLK